MYRIIVDPASSRSELEKGSPRLLKNVVFPLNGGVCLDEFRKEGI